MGSLKYIHSEETRQNWHNLPLSSQMGNIGSEVSRSLKWTEAGNQARADKAIDRALELFDFTIESNRTNKPCLTEILMARDEFCDYFFNGNSYHTDPKKCKNTTMNLLSCGKNQRPRPHNPQLYASDDLVYEDGVMV